MVRIDTIESFGTIMEAVTSKEVCAGLDGRHAGFNSYVQMSTDRCESVW